MGRNLVSDTDFRGRSDNMNVSKLGKIVLAHSYSHHFEFCYKYYAQHVLVTWYALQKVSFI